MSAVQTYTKKRENEVNEATQRMVDDRVEYNVWKKGYSWQEGKSGIFFIYRLESSSGNACCRYGLSPSPFFKVKASFDFSAKHKMQAHEMSVI